MFKKIIVIMALLASAAYARTRTFGYCERGGQTLSIAGISSGGNKVQRSYPQCTVTVYESGTLTLATLFSDDSGTPLNNPFTADTFGFWFFYANNGIYDIKMSGGGIPTPFTLGAVRVGASGILNVKDFGAVGDGATNDFDAIQAALVAACDSSLKQAVYFPSGQYNSAGTLIAGCDTSIFGDGPTLSSIFVTSQATLRKGIQTDFSLEIKDFSINTTPLTSNLAMMAVGRGFTGATSIGQNFNFTRFHSDGFNFGMIISGLNNNEDIINSLIVRDSIIKVYTVPGAVSNPVNSANIRLVVVENSQLIGDNNADHGVYTIAARDLKVSGNYMTGFDHAAVKVITAGFGGGSCPNSNTDYNGWFIHGNTITNSRLSLQAESYCSVIVPAVSFANNLVIGRNDPYAGNFASAFVQASCQSFIQNVDFVGNTFRNLGLGAITVRSSVQFPIAPCPDGLAKGTISSFTSVGDTITNFSTSFPGTFAAVTSSAGNLLRATVSNLSVDGGGNGQGALSIGEFAQRSVIGLSEVNTTEPLSNVNPALDLQQLNSAHTIIRLRQAASSTGSILSLRNSAGAELAAIGGGPGNVGLNFPTTPGVWAINGVRFHNARVIIGSGSLSGGAATINLDSSVAFSSGSSYRCTANSSSTTNGMRVSNTNGSSFVLNGNGSDQFGYICIGN